MNQSITKILDWNLLDVADLQILEAFNSKNSDVDYFIQRHLLPEPYIGQPGSSKVLFLALNPGYHEEDDIAHQHPSLRMAILDNLDGKSGPYPYYYLHEDPEIGIFRGFRWCRRIYKALINEIGAKELSEKIACIQFHGYHSRRYRSLSLLPSQKMSFSLIREAMSRKILIVLMRSRRIWISAIPELEEYPFLLQLKNPRNPTISPGNMQPGNFEMVLKALRS
jgi:hypothetical protein